MYDHGDSKSKLNNTKGGTASQQAERRDGSRHPFIASAEVIEIASGARFSTRTTDLGPGGCFVDTLVPFEAGSEVRIVVREGRSQFEATGIVVYSQAGLGMGIAFDELEPEQRRALAVWLGEEVEEHQQLQEPVVERRKSGRGLPHGSDRESLVRLVKLMTNKGILSPGEAASIFSDPVFF
jgi:hypothetical protein